MTEELAPGYIKQLQPAVNCIQNLQILSQGPQLSHITAFVSYSQRISEPVEADELSICFEKYEIIPCQVLSCSLHVWRFTLVVRDIQSLIGIR